MNIRVNDLCLIFVSQVRVKTWRSVVQYIDIFYNGVEEFCTYWNIIEYKIRYIVFNMWKSIAAECVFPNLITVTYQCDFKYRKDTTEFVLQRTQLQNVIYCVKSVKIDYIWMRIPNNFARAHKLVLNLNEVQWNWHYNTNDSKIW
jgi:hypothetical protein